MRLELSEPLQGAAVLALLATVLLLARRPGRSYVSRNTFIHPLASLVEPPTYRRPRLLLAVEATFILLLAAAASSPTLVEYKAVIVASPSEAELHVPPRAALVVALDVSGSMMGEKIEAAKRATASLVEAVAALGKPVDVGLIAFNHRIVEAVPPTSNASRVLEALQRLEARGGTMYTYPLSTAYSYLKPYRDFNETAILVFVTDGLPADSPRYRHVLRKLAGIGVRVYGVFIGSDPAGIREVEEMARIGHGKSYNARTAAEIVKVFQELAGEAVRVVEAGVNAVYRARVRIETSLSPPLYAAAIATYALLLTLRARESRVDL